MRSPIAFVSGNCVFAAGPHDPWAAFEVELSSYAWLTDDGKRARHAALLGAIEAVGADIQLLRVSSGWEAGDYLADIQRELAELRVRPLAPTPTHSQAHGAAAGTTLDAASRYARQQASQLARLVAVQPRLFLFVSLREPQRDVSSFLSTFLSAGPAAWRASIASALETGGRRFLRARELERVHCRAEEVELRLGDFLTIRAPVSNELQWLVRRAFCRGLGEPAVDGLHEPRALAFERNGEAVLAPLEGDVLRWLDGDVEHRARDRCAVESELGTSWQAHLVLGALPEQRRLPRSSTPS